MRAPQLRSCSVGGGVRRATICSRLLDRFESPAEIRARLVLWVDTFQVPNPTAPLDAAIAISGIGPLPSFGPVTEPGRRRVQYRVSGSGYASFSVLISPPSAGLPAYSCPAVASPPGVSAPTGLLPRNLFRISTMPRLQSPYPFFSCWHFVGSVSTSGGRRQSEALLRCTITQSDDWRHAASASPER